MVRFMFGVAGVVSLACLVGCSAKSADTTQVRGTVSGLTTQTQGARVVAVTSKGRTYWSTVDAAGGFALTVPSGTDVRLVVATVPALGRHPIAGHVVAAGGGRWIAANGATMQLGVLKPATAPAPGGIATKSEAPATESADGAEDDTHEDDAEDAELCGADTAGDVELHADAAPAGGAGDDKAGKDHEEESSRKACN